MEIQYKNLIDEIEKQQKGKKLNGRHAKSITTRCMCTYLDPYLYPCTLVHAHVYRCTHTCICAFVHSCLT